MVVVNNFNLTGDVDYLGGFTFLRSGKRTNHPVQLCFWCRRNILHRLEHFNCPQYLLAPISCIRFCAGESLFYPRKTFGVCRV